ncbi:MAG: exodeoxyribonuclease III [Xanthobacteraceae bacterium]
MRIATWNVNSVKARIEPMQRWLKERAPDIVCLQEIKCADDAFPRELFEELGYNIATHGQKTYNGVALLSKHRLDDIEVGLPGDKSDEQARYIEAVVSVDGGAVRVASIYLPNGNPAPGDKYQYKLAWMERLKEHARARLEFEEPMILAGDYNAIPTPADVHDSELWKDDALFLPQTREKFRALTHLGLVDAVRATSDDPGLYTFWDHQGGAFQKNNGIRIDHLLLSPQAADRLAAAEIDRGMRGGERPSDHVPVWIDLDV